MEVSVKQSVSLRQKALSVAVNCAYIASFIAVGSVTAGLRRADAFAEKARETYKRRMAPRRNAAHVRNITTRLPR